jgi:multicomponent Na+:H+ antiporter subunit F
MQLFVGFLSALVSLAVIVTLWAVMVRPGVLDRIIGVGVVGTKTTVLLGFVGVLFGRPQDFVDIVLTYALLNFIVVLAVAKYIVQREAVR